MFYPCPVLLPGWLCLLGCSVCEVWAWECRLAFPEVCSKLPALDNMWRLWQRFQKLKIAGGPHAVWANPSFDVKLGPIRSHCSCFYVPSPLSTPQLLAFEPMDEGGIYLRGWRFGFLIGISFDTLCRTAPVDLAVDPSSSRSVTPSINLSGDTGKASRSGKRSRSPRVVPSLSQSQSYVCSDSSSISSSCSPPPCHNSRKGRELRKKVRGEEGLTIMMSTCFLPYWALPYFPHCSNLRLLSVPSGEAAR